MTPEQIQDAINRDIAHNIRENFKGNKTITGEEVSAIIKRVLDSYSEYLELPKETPMKVIQLEERYELLEEQYEHAVSIQDWQGCDIISKMMDEIDEEINK